jgi:hypothetical protein
MVGQRQGAGVAFSSFFIKYIAVVAIASEHF